MTGPASLAARLRALSEALAWTAAAPCPALPAGWRRVLATGVGSSEAHARFLCRVLADAGRDARWVPLSAVAAGGAPDALLVVVSQGLSPNARLALASRERFAGCVVLTATRDDDADPAKRALLDALAREGVPVVRFAGAGEYGTLLRVTGPRCGWVAALRAARALAGGSPALADAEVRAIVASTAAADGPPALDAAAFAAPLAFVVTGTYGELTANLRYKVLEGLLAPAPPVWDALHLAHGPFQQAFAGPATFVALTRADAGPLEALLLDRFAAMLVPGRHRLVRLAARLPGPLAILDHEAALDAAVVAEIARRGIDQTAWPGRGHDAPLYGLAAADPPAALRLADATWPEVERAVAEGRRTAVVALGSTEQHGPHLPLATDTLVAEALAARLAARAGDAVQGPTLALGCAAEHLDFAGTLDVGADTLAATLAGVVRSLARHGIARVFVFSAHGGNCAALAAALPALRAAAPGVVVDGHTDLAAVTAALHAAAAAAGVEAAAAGHHAGEVETSILLALHPGLVRTDRLAPGRAAAGEDPQALFYPSLRPHAPDGTVGDPRGADAARGRAYLDAWTEVLLAAYRGAKKSARTTGIEST